MKNKRKYCIFRAVQNCQNRHYVAPVMKTLTVSGARYSGALSGLGFIWGLSYHAGKFSKPHSKLDGKENNMNTNYNFSWDRGRHNRPHNLVSQTTPFTAVVGDFASATRSYSQKSNESVYTARKYGGRDG